MTPTSILISGTYDANASHAGIGTDFRMCSREEATHISVYLIDAEHSEPVKDFYMSPQDMGGGAYVDALTLAAHKARDYNVGIIDRYQKKVSLTADSKRWDLSQVTPEAGYQSIQVAATCHEDDNIAVVAECSEAKTHYSVYLRRGDGTCEHVEDFKVGEALYDQALARVLAFNRAANLSMGHGVPIEPIR